jgi:hypothetical protein
VAGLTDVLSVVQNGVVAFNNFSKQMAGSLLNISGQLTTETANIAALQSSVRGPFTGLILSPNTTSTFGIAAGSAVDKTGVSIMTIASAYTKTTAAWAVGTGNGSFDGTGAAPSASVGWYHVFLIKRLDTNVVDVLTSLSISAPTLPANYTVFRRIGSLRTNGSFQWIKFSQTNNYFLWDIPVGDVNAFALTTVSRLFPLTVPTGLSVEAILNVFYSDSAAGQECLVQSPLISTQTVNSPLGNIHLYTNLAAGGGAAGQIQILTDASGNIRAVSSNGGAGGSFYVVTTGWTDIGLYS